MQRGLDDSNPIESTTMRTHMGPPAAHLPRGLLSRVTANGDPRGMLSDLVTAFDTFKAKHAGEMRGIQSVVDDCSRKLAALGITGGLGGPEAVDPEYTRPFAAWIRKGGAADESALEEANASGDRAQIKAAMSGGNDQSGGYLAPIEWDRKVLQVLRSVSPLRRLADVKQTSVRAYSTLWSDGQWGSGWVGETALRPATSTPNLTPIVFQPGELYANPAVTQQLLDDAQFSIADWLSNEVGAVFALQEGITFVSGDGVNKPTGFMLHVEGAANASKHPGGPIQVVASGAANQITPDGLIDLIYDLPAVYRQGCAFVMNSITANMISKMKDGQGNYIWRQALQAGEPSTLLGYEVAIDENMPPPVAGNIPVAFGNWQQGYVINDRSGMSVLRDPYTNKPYVQFYCVKRVGGGVKDPNALRVLRVAAAS